MGARPLTNKSSIQSTQRNHWKTLACVQKAQANVSPNLSPGLSCLLPAPPTGSALESSLAAAPRAFTPSHPLAVGGKPLWSQQYIKGERWVAGGGRWELMEINACLLIALLCLGRGSGGGPTRARGDPGSYPLPPRALQLGVEEPMNWEQNFFVAVVLLFKSSVCF